MSPHTDLSGITRIVVVGADGEVFERREFFSGGVELHVQDDGRTLKVFPLRETTG